MPDMTHPKGVTAEDREAAFSLDNVMSGGFLKPHEQLAYINGECDDWHNVVAMRDHRLSSTAALEAEIAFLKQRLESAGRLVEKGQNIVAVELRQLLESCCLIKDGEPIRETLEDGPSEIVIAMEGYLDAARAFLQEQEKQNG